MTVFLAGTYRKVQVAFIQKAFLLGLYSGELFSEGLITGRNFEFQWVGLDINNTLKCYENSLK